MSLVWYTGIVVNGLLVIFLTYFTLVLTRQISKTQPKEMKQERIVVAFSLLGILSVNISLLLLYLQMGTIQYDVMSSETTWPLLFLMGYHISLLSISFLMWMTCYSRNKIGIPFLLGQIAISIITVMVSGDYVVYWNNGAVLVALGFISDTITLWLGLAVGMIFLYSTLVKRMEELAPETEHNPSPLSSKLLLIALINFAQFLIPRAEVGSILDPFSVKFIGFLVTLGFGYTLYRYAISEDSEVEEISNRKDHQPVGPSVKQLSIAVIFAILFNLALQNQPEFDIEWREYLQSQSLFVGHYFNTNLYFNYFAVIIPVICVIIALAFLVITPKFKQVLRDKQAIAWLLLTGILQISFFLLAHLPLSSEGSIPSQTDTQTIIPLIISPIIVGIILEERGIGKGSDSFWFSKEKNKQIIRIVCLFGITLLAAFCVDMIVALPPFSEPMIHVFIGAAGLVDGLLWAPVMAVVSFETILTLKEIL